MSDKTRKAASAAATVRCAVYAAGHRIAIDAGMEFGDADAAGDAVLAGNGEQALNGGEIAGLNAAPMFWPGVCSLDFSSETQPACGR